MGSNVSNGAGDLVYQPFPLMMCALCASIHSQLLTYSVLNKRMMQYIFLLKGVHFTPKTRRRFMFILNKAYYQYAQVAFAYQCNLINTPSYIRQLEYIAPSGSMIWSSLTLLRNKHHLIQDVANTTTQNTNYIDLLYRSLYCDSIANVSRITYYKEIVLCHKHH